MARLKINWTFLIVILLSVLMMGLTVYGLRSWNRTYRAKVGFEQGCAAFEQKQWDKAVQYFGQYLSIHPTDTPTLLKYTHALMNIRPLEQNHMNQIINIYRSILRQEENLEAAKSLISIYLFAVNLPGEGQIVAERFLEKKDNPEIRQLLAACLIQQKQYDKAGVQLQMILKTNPTIVSAYDLMAQVAESKSADLSQPQQYFDKAIENNPKSAVAYIQRANFYLRTGKRDLAIADLTQAGISEFKTSDQKALLAEMWLRVGNFQQSRQLLEQVKAENPQNITLWTVNARIAMLENNPEQMTAVAEEGIKTLGDGAVDFLPSAVELFINANQIARAKECVDQLRQSQINPVILTYMDGLIAEKQNNWALAAQFYRKAIDLGRKDEDAVIRAARALDRSGDTPSAIQMISVFLNDQTESFQGHLLAGEMMSRRRQWTFAINHLRKAIQLNPTSSEAVILMLQTRIQRLASVRVTDDSWDAVINDITNLLSKQDNIVLRSLLYYAAMQSGNRDLAFQQVEQMKKSFPDQVRTYLIEAQFLIAEKKTQQAVEVLKNAAERNLDADLFRTLSLVLVQQADTDSAVRLLQNYIEKVDQSRQKMTAAMDLADIYASSGQRDKAYQLLMEQLKENPSSIQLLRKLLDLELNVEKVETLQSWIDQIKQIEGQQGRQWRYEQARLWFTRFEKKKYYVQIIDMLNEVLRMYPNDKQSLLLQAAAHEASANRQLALKSYLEAFNRDPDDIAVAVTVIGALYRNNEYRQGYELLSNLTTKGHQDTRLKQLEMEYLLSQGQLASASGIIEKELEKSPESQGGLFTLALLKIREKDYARAEELLNRILASQPDSISVIAAKVQLYMLQDKKDLAIELCNQTVARLNTTESLMLRCQTLINFKNFDLAKNDIETIRKMMLDKQPEKAHLFCAQLYSAAEDQDRAMQEVDQAVQLGLEDLDIQRAVAITLSVILERIDVNKQTDIAGRAESILNNLIAKTPQNVQAAFTLAMLAHNRNQLARAAEWYEKTLALEPTQVIAANNLAWILCNNQNNPQKALEYANRGLQIAPDYADLVDTRGTIYMALEDYQSAVVDYYHCLELYTADSAQLASTSFRLAKSLVKLGRIDEAKQQLQAAKKYNQSKTALTQEESVELEKMLQTL